MPYPVPETLEEEEELRVQEAHREGIEECPQKYERAGVTHLVHAWIQQGHIVRQRICTRSHHRSF